MTHEEYELQMQQVQKYTKLTAKRNDRIRELARGQGEIERNIHTYSELSATAKTRLINFSSGLYDEEKQKCHTEFDRETAKIGGEECP